MKHNAKILLLDIETAPILSWVWKIWDENIGINQIKEDSHLLSFAAKWLDDPKMMYADQRKEKNIEDDSGLLKKIWPLLDEADIVIGHNSKAFDTKVINTRLIINGIKPPSNYQHIDTKLIAKKHFRFTSNKLAYLSDRLCEHKKSNHNKFSGFELWRECLAGNPAAWKEMEKYNKLDVLSLEELYKKLQPWDGGYNPDLYTDDYTMTCACGSRNFQRRGFNYSKVGKYQRFQCLNCGAWKSSRHNEFTKLKRANLKRQN